MLADFRQDKLLDFLTVQACQPPRRGIRAEPLEEGHHRVRTRPQRQVELKLRISADLFRYLVRLPMRFFHTRRIGELLQRFQDNERLQQVMTGQAVAVVLDVLMVFSSLALMLDYSPQLTAITVLPIPVYGLLTLIFTPLWNRNHLPLVEQKARTESSLIETINSISAVKTGCAEQSSQWKHENHPVKSANIEMWGARLWMRMSGISSGVHIFASTCMLWYGSRLVIDGKLSIAKGATMRRISRRTSRQLAGGSGARRKWAAMAAHFRSNRLAPGVVPQTQRPFLRVIYKILL